MSNGRYIFLLTVLTALLFGVSQWLSNNPLALHEQSQKASANKKQMAPKRQASKRVTPQKRSVRMVTLYPAGSIAVKRAQPRVKPPAKIIKISKPKPRPVKKQRQPVMKVANASKPREGDRPTLEVGYDSIGFERYVEIMERIGRLFVLVEEDNRIKLGPEVSLKRRELIPSTGIRKGRYAVNRPHLIADPFIQDQLAGLKLPATALTDRVVLILNRPFDAMLWDAISEIAATKNVDLARIARISGRYVSKSNGIFLQLSHAILKNTLKEFSFRKSIRVTL